MIIKEIRIKNLRNIKNFHYTPNSRFNLIYGENGAGKTSILEAIYFLSHARTFRSTQTQTLINYDESEICVSAKVLDEKSPQIRSYGLSRDANGSSRARIDGEDVRKLSSLAEIMPVQLITPESMRMLSGGPAERRAFLDYLMFHVEPKFYPLWKKTKKILQNKLNLLKNKNKFSLKDELKAWNKELSIVGEQIYNLKKVHIEQFLPIFKSCLEEMSVLPVNVSYSKGWEEEASLEEALERNMQQELIRGSCLIGPQKNDLLLSFKGLPIDKIFSRGQLKAVVCGMSLAQASYIYIQKGVKPVFLLDDLPSELDMEAKIRVYNVLKSNDYQVFVTSVEKTSLTLPCLDGLYSVYSPHENVID